MKVDGQVHRFSSPFIRELILWISTMVQFYVIPPIVAVLLHHVLFTCHFGFKRTATIEETQTSSSSIHFLQNGNIFISRTLRLCINVRRCELATKPGSAKWSIVRFVLMLWWAKASFISFLQVQMLSFFCKQKFNREWI